MTPRVLILSAVLMCSLGCSNPMKTRTQAPAGAGNVKQSVAPSASMAETQAGKDAELTARIQQAITRNRKLSASAKAIRIIAHNGFVTLRGTVGNEQELAEVVTAAKRIAGTDKVDTQLEVSN